MRSPFFKLRLKRVVIAHAAKVDSSNATQVRKRIELLRRYPWRKQSAERIRIVVERQVPRNISYVTDSRRQIVIDRMLHRQVEVLCIWSLDVRVDRVQARI